MKPEYLEKTTEMSQVTDKLYHISSGEGRLDFHHRTISKVVRKMYLSDKTNQIWWHKRLTEYFEKW
jgi:hypothetical protein